jgi:hypothetical protein
MATREPNIVLFQRGRSATGEDGYWRVGYEYTLSEFGGLLPQKGDTIVPMQGDLDVTKHTVYEVEGRLFRPAGSPNSFINVALIVTERIARKEEQHLILGGG